MELLEKAKHYMGQEFEIDLYDPHVKDFVKRKFLFVGFERSVWRSGSNETIIELIAVLESSIDGNRIFVTLEKLIHQIEGKPIMNKSFKFKEYPFTFNSITRSVLVAAVPGESKSLGKKGFLSYSFKGQDGPPNDPRNGTEISNVLYDTEDEAITEGYKVLKEQLSQSIRRSKKK